MANWFLHNYNNCWVDEGNILTELDGVINQQTAKPLCTSTCGLSNEEMDIMLCDDICTDCKNKLCTEQMLIFYLEIYFSKSPWWFLVINWMNIPLEYHQIYIYIHHKFQPGRYSYVLSGIQYLAFQAPISNKITKLILTTTSDIHHYETIIQNKHY